MRIIDTSVLRGLSYGMYVVSTLDGARFTGCVVNTVSQSTSAPVTVTVCVNKDNHTNSCIKNSGGFTVSILSENVPPAVIGTFGFGSGRDADKFANVPFGLAPSGLPYLTGGVCGWLDCKVLGAYENFTHTVFIAEVVDAGNLSKDTPMTYSYYHNVIKGKTPRNASSYSAAAQESAPGVTSRYVCGVCKYEYPGSAEEFGALPGDYVCPVCGAAKDKFA